MSSNEEGLSAWHSVGPGRRLSSTSPEERRRAERRSAERGELADLNDVPSAHVVERATSVLQEWAAIRLGATVLRATPSARHSVEFELRSRDGEPLVFAFGWVYPYLVDLPGVEHVVHRRLDWALDDGHFDRCAVWWSGVDYELDLENQ